MYSIVCSWLLLMLLLCHHPGMATTISEQIQLIEKRNDGRLGIATINTGNNQQLHYRANERFPMGCTSKVIGVAAVLSKAEGKPEKLNKRIHYGYDDLTTWSPITGKNIDQGMTVKDLCQAAISYSDNSAMNFLVKELGGVRAMTQFARTLGDKSFRQDRTWPEEAKAGGDDVRDSSTPALMAANLYQLLFGTRLDVTSRQLLKKWMLHNTTGDHRIRAGVPKHWQVADKTGTGMYYGTTNDIAILFPPNCPPIVVAIYFTQNKKEAKPNSQVVADVTEYVIRYLADHDSCIRESIS